MGSLLGTILSFIIVFGILVFVHEFGHFFMAKLVGIRVDVFSFGYGKRLFGFKKGDTDYRVSLIPMGGYVKFPGEDVYENNREVESGDFMAAKRWQRLLTIVMGPIMNILLAIVLVAAINMVGAPVPVYQDQTPVIGWVEPSSPAEKADLHIDDEILSIDDQKTETWSDV
jgi:regulator of sigma E protease